MRTFIESNFILETALSQEQETPCERMLDSAEAGHVQLVLPSFCIAEALRTFETMHSQRNELAQRLAREFGQLRRSAPYRDEVLREGYHRVEQMRQMLVRSRVEQRTRLESTLLRILRLAELIPITGRILESAADCASRFQLDGLGDAVVCASILYHLDNSERTPSVFVEKDRADFSSPDLQEELDSKDCRICFQFGEAIGYLNLGL